MVMSEQDIGVTIGKDTSLSKKILYICNSYQIEC
jgi:hypothetical protein